MLLWEARLAAMLLWEARVAAQLYRGNLKIAARRASYRQMHLR
jgi:hypothetical protein